MYTNYIYAISRWDRHNNLEFVSIIGWWTSSLFIFHLKHNYFRHCWNVGGTLSAYDWRSYWRGNWRNWWWWLHRWEEAWFAAILHRHYENPVLVLLHNGVIAWWSKFPVRRSWCGWSAYSDIFWFVLAAPVAYIVWADHHDKEENQQEERWEVPNNSYQVHSVSRDEYYWNH